MGKFFIIAHTSNSEITSPEEILHKCQTTTLEIIDKCSSEYSLRCRQIAHD